MSTIYGKIERSENQEPQEFRSNVSMTDGKTEVYKFKHTSSLNIWPEVPTRGMYFRCLSNNCNNQMMIGKIFPMTG